MTRVVHLLKGHFILSCWWPSLTPAQGRHLLRLSIVFQLSYVLERCDATYWYEWIQRRLEYRYPFITQTSLTINISIATKRWHKTSDETIGGRGIMTNVWARYIIVLHCSISMVTLKVIHKEHSKTKRNEIGVRIWQSLIMLIQYTNTVGTHTKRRVAS